jgi:hypothetical protein
MGEVSAGWGPPYWIEVFHLDEDGLLRVITLAKLEERDDRLAITRLILDAGTVDSATLRETPVARIEAVANSALRDPAVLEDLARGVRRREWASKGVVLSVSHPSAELIAADKRVDEYLDAMLAGRPEADRAAAPAEQVLRRPLVRPDGTDPEGFSHRVAEAYNAVVMLSHRPATLLAEEAGVPVTTVHRWIRDARQRGFLPPARRGRAG